MSEYRVLNGIFGYNSTPLSWLVYPLSDGKMQRVNLSTLTQLTSQIHALNHIRRLDDEIVGMLFECIDSIKALTALLGSNEFQLRISKKEAEQLLIDTDALLKFISPAVINSEPPEEEKKKDLRLNVENQVKEFERVLKIDLEQFHSYIIPKEGIYDIDTLIDTADVMVDNYKSKLSGETLENIRSAGRCLAFNLYTACGFHILRATESVVIKWMLSKGIAQNSIAKNRNWGAYVRVLRSHSADEKIVRLIDTVREHHRNPIIHPSESLDADEANALFSICQTLMLRMLKEI